MAAWDLAYLANALVDVVAVGAGQAAPVAVAAARADARAAARAAPAVNAGTAGLGEAGFAPRGAREAAGLLLLVLPVTEQQH